VSVWITADDKRCFPGFHVANLAAALSVKNCPVRLFDRSGLLPNAGFFMSLSPQHYIRWGDNGVGSAAGLVGVEIDCSPRGCRKLTNVPKPARVEIVHLPPLSPSERLQETVCELKSRAGTVDILVLLRTARTPGEENPASVAAETSVAMDLRPAVTCAFNIAERPRARAFEASGQRAEESGAVDLGAVADWEGALDDRVPVVIRAPDSALSRAYRSASDTLLFKVNDLGRKFDATRALGISTGTGPRLRHR
jgi:hypothetical protein